MLSTAGQEETSPVFILMQFTQAAVLFWSEGYINKVHGDPGNSEFADRKITSSRPAEPHKVIGQPQKYREILSPENQVI